MAEYRVEKNSRPEIDKLVNVTDNSFVTIKRMGAEVIGYTVFDKLNNKELPLLWNNDNDSLPFEGAWKNHATVLFPIVGGLKDNKSKFGEYEISSKSNHGFARHSLFELVDEVSTDKASVTYKLSSNADTKRYYPFNFNLFLTFTLEGNSLTLKTRIENIDKRDILFQFGWHPGFSTELGLGGKREDWQIIFNKGNYRHIHVVDNGDSYLTGEKSEVEFDGAVNFSDTELYNTVMLEIDNKDNRECTLYNPKIKRGVKVKFSDFPHLGLWANKGQDYLCVEPWQGLDDHLEQEPFDKKIGMVTLEPKKAIEKSVIITPIIE